jgi:hypothetical protein
MLPWREHLDRAERSAQMAIMPEVLLRLWRVGVSSDSCYHFFVTWDFAWSRSFRPVVDDDFHEFLDWFSQRVSGEGFDEYLARVIKNYFDDTGKRDELVSLRYNFYRSYHDGGNIIELSVKSDTEDVANAAMTVMESLSEAFIVFGTEKLRSFWLGKGEKLHWADDTKHFYSSYTRCYWGPSSSRAEPMRTEEWAKYGPSSDVREMVPVGA